MNSTSNYIGKAKAALVFGEGDSAQAAIVDIVATAKELKGDSPLSFTGAVAFDDRCQSHIQETIFPIVDRILKSLGTQPRHFVISAANLGAASVMDMGISVTGFSADVSVFLAMLSAALEIIVPLDAVATGHINSQEGSIAPVQSLPAKLRAVMDDDEIKRFLYPSMEHDASISTFTPNEKQRMEEALILAKQSIRCHAVQTLSDVVEFTIPDEAIVLSSLRHGFWRSECRFSTDESAYSHLMRYFLTDHDCRFWSVLESLFISKEIQRAKRLLTVRIAYEIQCKNYPPHFGLQLYRFLHSLPPYLIQRIDPPLAAVTDCVRMAQYADDDRSSDISYLFRAVNLEIKSGVHTTQPSKINCDRTPSDTADRVDAVLEQILEPNLAQTIGAPIDRARASFLLESTLVQSSDEFFQIVTAFYLHVLRHTRNGVECTDAGRASSEAYALLERAYADRGGVNAALLESREGTHGGMRSVLDRITDWFHRAEREKYLNRVLGEILDPLDWNGKVEFTSIFLERIRPFLPEEFQNASPKQYAHHYGDLMRLYVQCKDRFSNVIKSL